jgi:hypothetical protein
LAKKRTTEKKMTNIKGQQKRQWSIKKDNRKDNGQYKRTTEKTMTNIKGQQKIQ